MILYIRDFKGSTREYLEMIKYSKINETTKTPDSPNNLEPKNNARRITIPGLKLYYRARVIKNNMVQQKWRLMEQNRRPKHKDT